MDKAKLVKFIAPQLKRLVSAGLSLAMLLMATSVAPRVAVATEEDERFEGYEIRVIRPRFMQKAGRLELGGQGVAVLNQSFIYTFLASGILDYHFSESWAVEMGGSYGFSIDKEDKRILVQTFDIHTQVLQTQYIANLGLVWTPIYGKTQLPSGDLVYFDSFMTVQGGMTGIDYTYDNCLGPTAVNPNAAPKPAESVKPYPTILLGAGQKFYMSRDWALRWDARVYIFQYGVADGSCTPGVSQGTAIKENITIQFGASYFL